MLNKAEFVKLMQKKAEEYGEVEIQTVSRVNLDYLGMYVKRNNVPTPVINLDAFYDHYCETGNDPESYFEYIDEALNMHRNFNFDPHRISDWDWAKDKLYFRLLGNVVNGICIPVADMYLVPYLYITEDDSATVRITTELIDAWGVTTDDVFAQAKENQSIIRPFTIDNMSDVLGCDIDIPLYVVTTENHTYGAAAILYPGVAEQVREIVGEDFYLLPSSVHEMLALPKSMAGSMMGLTRVVVEANRTAVAEDDQLSDSVYVYDFVANTLKKVSPD